LRDVYLFWQASESAARIALSQLSLEANNQSNGLASSTGKPGTGTLPIPPQQWYQQQQKQQRQSPFSSQAFHHQQHNHQGMVVIK
jgi:hypothetical protein